MPFRSNLLGLAGVVVLILSPALAPASAQPGTPPGTGPCPGGELYPGLVRAAEVTGTRTFARAARRADRSVARLTELARDPGLYLDRCGTPLYAEPALPASPSLDAAGTLTASLDETFTLHSNPGAKRTVYLDFTGASVTGTGWNEDFGSTITVSPYSITAPADLAFSDDELTQIQRAWAVVAEDYAPFDVDVTTEEPPASALARSSVDDQYFGTRVVVTGGGPIYSWCGCGGIAYVDVFDSIGSTHAYYQPAWVFTQGTGTSGKNIGEAASHEAGHNLGLSHDTAVLGGYYSGASPWAPIMGSGYSQPVTQWSRGQFLNSLNLEDDLAIISAGAPYRADDHGGTSQAATPVADGETVTGVIGRTADVDAFSVLAAGATTVSVTPTALVPNLDVQLTVLDGAGDTVAVLDPPVARVSSSVASGLGATWTATLPETPGTYTLLVEGIGSGNPLDPGRYSDYGSLGAYAVSVQTDVAQAPNPLTLVMPDAPRPVLGEAYEAPIVGATGGLPPYSFTASGLPPGLTLAADGTLSGVPEVAGDFPVVVGVVDDEGTPVEGGLTVVVESASTVAPTPLAFATAARLPSARAHTAYRVRLRVSGGEPSLVWRHAQGAWPKGLRLSWSADRRLATVTGRPRAKGLYTITYVVRDGADQQVRRRFVLRVLPRG